MTVRVRSARSGAPTAQRTMIGRSRRTPSGMSSTTPCAPERAGQLGELVVGREGRPPSMSGSAPRSGCGREEVRDRRERRRRRSRRAGDRAEAVTPPSVKLDEPVGAIGERPATPRPRRDGSGDDAGVASRSAGAEVDVRRVEPVRFGRQRLVGLERRAAVGGEPVRAGQRRGRRARTRSIGSDRSSRARRAGRGPWTSTAGALTRATPPSPASRGG